MFIIAALFLLVFIFGNDADRKYALKVLFFMLILGLIGVPHPITAALGAAGYAIKHSTKKDVPGGGSDAKPNTR